MMTHVRACLWLLGLTVVVCCLLYPLALWGVGQAFFADEADGSLVPGPHGLAVVGSRLVGQQFKGAGYFHPRPSATTPGPYNAAASGASNWGASNPQLRERVVKDLASISRGRAEPVPADLVMASGSGLDPHITRAGALYQLPRVAAARASRWRTDEARARSQVEELINRLAFRPLAGLAGDEPIVNVLELNLELDRLRLP
jgi:K+-transporting ATPase ATPase C chain